ncbi:zf-HC2 domain-containing protein [Dyella halodurans]|uniref:Anti-sigma factor family protein n=1 Tax=Dyella halodurans TaxID=1920171 RepID=A0ABV9C369_9GAMM|nr:zf-HC2 domain-containing protein [Dyella halodurans]
MKSPSDIDMDCARAWDAMPWVLQHSATPALDEWLTQHLAQCASCRAEFAQQSRLRRALSLPSDIPLDANAGLRRLLARVDAPDTEEISRRSRPPSWLTRALVAAVLVQALGIGVLGAKLWLESAHPAYRTLSQNVMPAPAGAIHVVPDESMKVAEWNALLHSLHLQVVGGPNDVGAYTVVPAGAAATSNDILQKLRGTQGIRLAEPVAVTQ